MRGCGRTGQIILVNLIIIASLIPATLAGQLYVHLVQRPLCYAYAGANAPAAADLEFVGVVIATNTSRRHICTFRDPASAAPVSVAFAEEDIPYLADTFQVLSMVCSVLCFALIGFGLLSLGLARMGLRPYWSVRNPGRIHEKRE